MITTCLIVLSTAQDYQEYSSGPGPRQAPLRLSPSSQNEAPTPVPILKQINKHNEDGSYTYGYEGADGSFKIETKLATGEVKGKYGYVDETGKVRVVEYGANKYGFQPSGEGITVAPPTLVDETTRKDRLEYEEEQPQYIARVPRPQTAPQRFAPPPSPPKRPQPPPPQPQYDDYDEPQQQQYQPPQPQPRPQPKQPLYTSAPIPQRPQVPGSVPIDVVYASRPKPPRPEPEYTQKSTFQFGPTPQVAPVRHSQPQAIQPQPQYQPQPAYQAPRAQQGRSTSVLDQLAKDFALPQGGSPALHDISFGYY